MLYFRSAATCFCFALFYILMFLSYKTIAQHRWEPGFIVLAKGDTLNGYILNSTYIKKGRLASFRKDKTGVVVPYTANDLRSYYVNSTDDLFESFILPDTPGKRMAFLQVIVKGEINYYYLKDTTGESRYFIKKADGILQELRQIKNEQVIDGHTYNSTYKEYLIKLKAAFTKCDTIIKSPGFDNLPFLLTPMGKKIVTYNKCITGTNTYMAARLRNQGVIELFVSAGPSFNTVLGNSFQNVLPHPKMIMGYSSGFGFNFYDPLVSKAVSMQVTADFINKGAHSDETHVTFNMHCFSFSLMGKYTYPYGKVRPFFGAGLAYSYSMNTKNSYYRIVNGEKVLMYAPYQDYYGSFDAYHQVGFCSELGLKIPFGNHNLLVYGRYDYSRILFAQSWKNYTPSSAQLRIGYSYRFNLKAGI